MDYDELARAYDSLTRDVGYEELCAFLAELLRQNGVSEGTVLDLACGTGTLSLLLAREGYEVIGVDASGEMLAVAAAKDARGVATVPVFIRQDMRELDLYGTVNACVCTLDAVNHVTEFGELCAAFKRLALFVEPSGLFVFDVLTRSGFKDALGISIDDGEDCYCVWSYDEAEAGLFEIAIDLFSRERDVWRRGGEVFYERVYTNKEIHDALTRAGFEIIGVYGDRKFAPPESDEKRVFYAARKLD